MQCLMTSSPPSASATPSASTASTASTTPTPPASSPSPPAPEIPLLGFPLHALCIVLAQLQHSSAEPADSHTQPSVLLFPSVAQTSGGRRVERGGQVSVLRGVQQGGVSSFFSLSDQPPKSVSKKHKGGGKTEKRNEPLPHSCPTSVSRPTSSHSRPSSSPTDRPRPFLPTFPLRPTWPRQRAHSTCPAAPFGRKTSQREEATSRSTIAGFYPSFGGSYIHHQGKTKTSSMLKTNMPKREGKKGGFTFRGLARFWWILR